MPNGIHMMRFAVILSRVASVTVLLFFTAANAQTPQPPAGTTPPGSNQPGPGLGQTPAPGAPSAVPPSVVPPPDYVIGADDVLTIVFWREPDISGDVTVRPDGIVSLPLINDVTAAGQTPEQLRAKIQAAATRYLTDPNVSVVVKQINSRKVFITGMVNKIGPFPLTAPTTVLQLISMAGGLLDYAKEDKISVVRTEKGRQVSFRFNYKEVSNGKRLEQNILLLPGDTVVVP